MKLAVVGAGSWGTTIAKVLSDSGHEVMLWVREKDILDSLSKNRKNPFVGSLLLPPNVLLSNELDEVLAYSDYIFNAIPVQYIRKAYHDDNLLIGKKLINLSKGFELVTFKRPSEIFSEKGIKYFVTLSGPSYAEEVAREVPTSVVAASEDIKLARKVRDIFSTDYFRVYSSNDVTGVEVAGALKNVVAIAAGIIDGLGGWNNTKAALITRATVEIARLGVTLGGKAETFGGLAGVGDLVVTCTGKYSRNRGVGERLARGENLNEIITSSNMVAEGVPTCKAIYELSLKLGVELPIVREVYSVLYNSKVPMEAIKNLMSRNPKDES